MTPSPASAALVHRLLWSTGCCSALLEMRTRGLDQNDKVVFYLADLFHTTALDLEAAAEGKMTYVEVFRLLEGKAKERGIERWLAAATAEVEGRPAPVTSSRGP